MMLIVVGVVYLLPILINQLTSLIISSQNIYSSLQDLIIDLSMNPVFQNIDIQQTIPTTESLLCGYPPEYPP